jgi:CRP-like cAMP-binding protein
MNDVLYHMDIVKYAADDIVFEIGSEGDLFYFIIEGSVEILIPDSENIEEFKKSTGMIQFLQDELNYKQRKIKEIK